MTMTDKTSTAPVSEAFARAVCDGIWVGEEVRKNTPRMLRAINAAIASANAPDVVAAPATSSLRPRHASTSHLPKMRCRDL